METPAKYLYEKYINSIYVDACSSHTLWVIGFALLVVFDIHRLRGLLVLKTMTDERVDKYINFNP